MELFNNIFCVTSKDLTGGNPRSDSVKERPVMSEEALHSYTRRYPHVVVRNGGGPNRPALLQFDKLRSDLKLKLKEKYGHDLEAAMRRNKLAEMIEPDLAAARFYADYQFDDGSNLKPERQAEYNANAMVLNAVGKLVSDRRGKLKSIGNACSMLWNEASEAVNNLDRQQFPHSLPSNPLRLKEKYRNYIDHGYLHLVHKGKGNANAKKVNGAAERLILSLYCQQNLPFGSWVYDDYLAFIAGKKEIVDRETGVLYNREDFFDHQRGTYIIVSRSTVWNITHNPANTMFLDKFRNNRTEYETRSTPMNSRHAPEFSLSKITMDDRDLPRKTKDGEWVHSYFAFDVTSQVVLSCVYSLKKPDHAMVWRCFRELYRAIDSGGLMWPGEVEVENHLMKDIAEELRAMFPVVTFCAPGSPQSKRAEHFIRFLKYQVEKRRHKGVGRHTQKGAYKTIKAGKGEEYEQEHLPLEQIIAESKEDIAIYNNMPHPDQKKFPGKTRLQVLMENMNPDLGRPQKYKLLKYVGEKTETSIRNNDFAKVQYEKYAIDNLSAISRLKPNNYEVEAYYLPQPDGAIGEVFLYQGDTFITRATKVERYNESVIERTADDERIRTDQSKRKAHFFKVMKEKMGDKITRKLEISEPMELESIEPEVVVIQEEQPVDFETQLDEDTRYFMSEEYKSRSLKTI